MVDPALMVSSEPWQWQEWVAWGSAIALGGYGAWQSHRTARRLRLTEQDWKLEHVIGAQWRITNISHQTYEVSKIRVPDGWIPRSIEAEDIARVTPNDYVIVQAARSANATDRWKVDYRIARLRWLRRTQTCALPTPPKNQ